MIERATQNFFCGEKNSTFIFISETRARVVSILPSDRYVVVFVERNNTSRSNVVSFFFGVAFEKKKKNKRTTVARD